MAADSHRKKVYAAERAAFRLIDTDLYATEDEVVSAVRRIEGLAEFRERWPNHRPLNIKVRRHRRGWHWYRGVDHSVTLNITDVKLWIICHEVAHSVTGLMFPSHGVEFVQNYLAIVEMEMGVEARDLLFAALEQTKAAIEHGPRNWARTRTRVRCSNLTRAARPQFGLEPDEQVQGVRWMRAVTHEGQTYSGFFYLDEERDMLIVRDMQIRARMDGRPPVEASEVKVRVKDVAYIS